ncbi:MAG: thiamine pyrophosphate-dependent dehydrogenase E1 component subunit alpha [Chloroflexi bacterium]|nr:thiamine pyrophosphate-dependent dehydrogenase E1 component subunit alpha [Chloroflexota bacterium]MDK1045811.1 thiamine pyrophosphate-dependent dehydrogenase E1 component subunit alpha [Anaerolineales bacterium]MCH8340849.1 thiamine pyrophosphate-dependent dehydrogenase E1 component subunit alpha [Chloroflexota bacterium]MCH8876854.1 thiamine pyrophosphate-dependent dehydrogenase E1 component subunit alpha [Chloroflexota bacterium]MCI0773466.1 thiamine pyrophosphate-dependent dehydrogenase 
MEAQEDLQLNLNEESLLEMYGLIVLSRRLDERTWVLHRQGKIAFHISGIGHEAAQVGAAMALRRGQDWVVPYYRDLAMMLALGLTPKEFMLGVMGKKGEPSSGARQMPSHWSIRRMNVVSHSSPVATQTPHASGIGLAIKMRGDDAIVLTSIGEGATSQGAWYEAVNWAAIHKLPVVFMVENNLYAISVRQDRQMAVEHVADKAAGLGLPGVTVDGLDALAVHRAISEAAARARAGDGPTLVEAMVQRMTPHSSDDDDRSYRPRAELEALKAQDPVRLQRDKLMDMGLLSEQAETEVQERAAAQVEEAIKFAASAPYPEVSEASYPVYAGDRADG